MTTDFRALCVELVRIADALDGGTPLISNQGQALDGYSALAAFRAIANRARAALAEPEPEGPTDEEIMELMPQQMRDDLAAAARAMSGFDPDNIKAASVFRIILNRHVADHARAVLARWGRPAPAPAGDRQAAPVPVAVSERLPEPGVKVIAHYLNGLSKSRTVCAIWVPAKSRSDDLDSSDDDFTEYDEETDRFYWPEGWYETIENWDDLGYVKIYEGEVIYWQPLPQWPAQTLPLPSGEVE